MNTTTSSNDRVRLVRSIRPAGTGGTGYFTGWGPRVPGI
jgi:hypothetical protein